MRKSTSNGQHKRKVAIYGRVSTEHEAQLSALKNQLHWYDDLLERHEDWELVEKYIDEGITGTNAKKRDHFNDMIRDAKEGAFDLIVTREVCRFSRNTVDTLEYTRMLRKHGVEVYFVEDNIYTFSSDGELRLTIMAALAQEESRKVSERVLAGQQVSREKGILYGNGNILGYKLVRKFDESGKWSSSDNTYAIDEEQAATVRLIYKLYIDGMSTTKIARKLTELECKGASGREVKWSATRVSRILKNKTYCGYLGYNKSETTDYLEHSRRANYDYSTYEYVKADFEPIVDEVTWNKVQDLLHEKSMHIPAILEGKHKHIGKKPTHDMWSKILKCSCGASFRKNKWRTNKNNGLDVYGYQCYNQLNYGSYNYRKKNGLPTDGCCSVKMVADWRLDMFAKLILEELWHNRKSSVKEALKLVRQNYVPDTSTNISVDDKAVRSKIATLESKSEKLLELRLDDLISKEEFSAKRSSIDKELTELRAVLADSSRKDDSSPNELNTVLLDVERALNEYIDFSKIKVADEIVEQFIKQVTVYDGGRFKFLIDFSNSKKENDNRTEVFLFERKVSFDEAYNYRKRYGFYIRKNQWSDVRVEVWTLI